MINVLDTMQKAALAAQFADDKKAADIEILDVRGLCNFTDALLICTGNNRIQLNAIVEHISEQFKKMGIKGVREEGQRSPNWLVLDYGDVVIHVMSQEARGFYRLEKLWGDAKSVNWTEVPQAATAG